VLALIAQGAGNRAIADALVIVAWLRRLSHNHFLE
jgi:hypothetical protein